jgi:hypothetical protein
MKVDGPGTIGLHPLGPEQRGGRAATAFLLRDAKPALAGGGKKLATDVAGSRSRRCFFSVAGLRSDLINRVRGGRGFGQQRDREIASWLQSIRAFSNRTVEGFAGSRAGKPLALIVILRVGGGPCQPCDRARLKTAPPFAPRVRRDEPTRSVRRGRRSPTRATAASPLASWTIRAFPLRSARCGPDRGRRGHGCDLLASLCRRPTWPPAAPRASGALLCEMSTAAFFASWDRHRRRRPARGFGSRHRRRVELGPQGDARPFSRDVLNYGRRKDAPSSL